MNEVKVESCSRVKDENGSLALCEVEVRRIWKNYFKDFYNEDTQEEVGVHMCGYDGVQRGNCFGGEPFRKIEIEDRIKQLRYGKAAGKDEVTEEMVKGGGDGGGELDLEAV